MKLTPYSYLLFFFLFAAVGVFPSQAQEGAESQRSMLPDIDPQDIEIRSEFQANFRGLSRQPILGFQPEDQIYQIDTDRTPFIESEEQRMADLPVVELSRPDPPKMELFSYPKARNIYSQMGYGSYRSPNVKMFTHKELGSESRFTAYLDHHSSAGHLRDGFGAFRNLKADAGYYAKLGEGQLDLNVGGESNFNNLYPLAAGLGSDNFRNEFDGAHLKASYQRYTNSFEGWEVSASYDLFEVQSRILGLTGQTREHEGRVQGAYQWTGKRLHELYRIDVIGERGGFSGSQTEEGWYQIGADLTYERLWDYELLLNGSVGIHGAEEPNGGKLLLPTSNIMAKYWFGNDLTLRATFETDLSSESLKSRFEDNPFIMAFRPQFAHSYRIGGGIKAEYQPFNRSLISVKAAYHHVRDYAYLARGKQVSRLLSDIVNSPGGEAAATNFYKTLYDKARVAKLQFSVTHDLIPQTFWIDLSGTLRDHALKDGSSRPIPHLSDYTLTSSLYVKPIDSFRIRLWGDYVGPRSTSDGNEELNAYFTVNSRFEMHLGDRFGLFVEGRNILDEQYEVWEGYTARPLQLYGGMTWSF